MEIRYHENTKTFHLFNEKISYIMQVIPTGHLVQVYYGKHIHDRDDFGYFVETSWRPMASYMENGSDYSLEYLLLEYGTYGSSDYREPATEILQPNGSRLTDYIYDSYEVTAGKPKLEGLPAVYTEDDSEAETLTVRMRDAVTGVALYLSYTIFADSAALCRSARYVNEGSETLHLTRAMSLCMDLPDRDYEFVQFSGAWARERQKKIRKLEQGIQSIGSMRGHSSHYHNPFLILQRPGTDEAKGEAIGFNLVYSGNFLAQAEVTTHDTTRVLLGIHPDWFDWKLAPGAAFQTPEAVMVYTDQGLNDLSRTYHELYRSRLARGVWRDRPRPILLNNWEGTYFNFDEEKLLAIARTAKDVGVELFVLDDGWFGARRNDRAGLGDWVPNTDILPGGIKGLSEKIAKMGLMFGLWIEPEMVNPDSDLYRSHPDWILQIPERGNSQGRWQHVLDFSRAEVVDAIYEMLEKVFRESEISYVKWDMNRSITECYSAAYPADQQGEIFHRYILGVYRLYERLIGRFPHILFESCASGGARFDPGMLYYAPQAWTSDDTDAAERIRIQYGTSYAYPVSSMGSHVSIVPNHQLFRTTPLHTRANVAYFGTFGYELDLNRLGEEERKEVREQIVFMKTYREIIQQGTFYRLLSPFAGNEAGWMAVSADRNTAIVGWYRFLNTVNAPFTRMRLAGLDPDKLYEFEGLGESHYGDELMSAGLITSDSSCGQSPGTKGHSCDFDSRIWVLKAAGRH